MTKEFTYSPITSHPLVVRDGQQATTLHDAAKDWVADGTETAAPVTTSTPAPVAAPVVVEERSPVSAAPAAPAIEGNTLEERSRNWAKTPDAPSTPAQAATAAAGAAAAAGASPGEQQAAAAAAAEAFIEAQYNGQPFKIPEGVLVPVKQDGRTILMPMKDYLGSVMRQADYQRKTANVAERVRAVEAQSVQQKATEARLAEVRRQLDERAREIEEARNDPEKMEQLEEHQRLYASNPTYRKNVDDARAKSISDAQLAVYQQDAAESTATAAVTAIKDAIATFAVEYPGVNPELVQQAYAEALYNERTDLTEASLRSFFEAESQRVNAATAPLQGEMAAMKEQLATLQRQLADAASARAHNDEADRILERDRQGRFVKPSNGAPPVAAAGSRNREPYAGSLISGTNDRHKSWVNS